MLKVKRALISVSDKTGLEELAKGLAKYGVEILSTGGTAKKIASLGIKVRDVSDYTGFPEMLDGRVKTLHPKVHGALLALRSNKEHMDTVKKHSIELIDMVVVNLYPFEKVTANPNVKLEEAIENIDIGGPSMLRSAAKNAKSVAVVCDAKWYSQILNELNKNNGAIGDKLLESLRNDVFKRTAEYDAGIYSFLSKGKGYQVSVAKVQDLRYGENPHQKAAFYVDESIDEPSVSKGKQLQGKELSYNNIMDLDAAIEIVKDFDGPAVSVIKHTNPCGAATADSLSEAYLNALDCDRTSAFGSIVGLNGAVDKATAETIMKEADFVECIIAPSFSPDALGVFKRKKNLRIIEVGDLDKKPSKKDVELKKVVGGLLVQDRDKKNVTEKNLKVVTKRKPTEKELESLLFGDIICKHVKSNAIVFCQGTKTVGVGAGQMSRVDSVIIASRKAGAKSKGGTLASDAFFPKPDGIEMAHKAGIKAIIQPGGSIKDQDVIKKADELDIAMVFTGIRHFKH